MHMLPRACSVTVCILSGHKCMLQWSKCILQSWNPPHVGQLGNTFSSEILLFIAVKLAPYNFQTAVLIFKINWPKCKAYMIIIEHVYRLKHAWTLDQTAADWSLKDTKRHMKLHNFRVISCLMWHYHIQHSYTVHFLSEFIGRKQGGLFLVTSLWTPLLLVGSEWARQWQPMLCWRGREKGQPSWSRRASRTCCTLARRPDPSCLIWFVMCNEYAVYRQYEVYAVSL